MTQMSLCYFLALEKLTCRVAMVGSNHARSSMDIMTTAKNHSSFTSELLVASDLSGYDTVAC